MYTEASDLFFGDVARLRSPVETLNEPHCLRFWYMLYGKNIRYIRTYLYKPGTGMQVKIQVSLRCVCTKLKHAIYSLRLVFTLLSLSLLSVVQAALN